MSHKEITHSAVFFPPQEEKTMANHFCCKINYAVNITKKPQPISLSQEKTYFKKCCSIEMEN